MTIKPSEKTIKRLFAQSGNICAFPGCDLPIVENAGTVTGEICHIKAKSSEGPRFDPKQSEKERHSFDNLVLLCRRHHKIIDAEPEVYAVDALEVMKSVHENSSVRPEKAEDLFFAKILLNNSRQNIVTNNAGNVAINSPGAVQTGSITVKTTNKKVSVTPPPGTIGANQQASRYMDYLIKRYNKYAATELSRKTKFSYGAVSRNIETTFGSPWRLLPLDLASEVFEYLQGRIAKTRQGKNNASRGYKFVSSFEEFSAKHPLRNHVR